MFARAMYVLHLHVSIKRLNMLYAASAAFDSSRGTVVLLVVCQYAITAAGALRTFLYHFVCIMRALVLAFWFSESFYICAHSLTKYYYGNVTFKC